MCVVFFGGQTISCVSNYYFLVGGQLRAKAPGEKDGLSKYMVLSMTLTGVISTLKPYCPNMLKIPL